MALAYLNPNSINNQICDVIVVFNFWIHQVRHTDLFERYPALVVINQYVLNEWGADMFRWNIFHLEDHMTNNDIEGFHWKVNILFNFIYFFTFDCSIVRLTVSLESLKTCSSLSDSYKRRTI